MRPRPVTMEDLQGTVDNIERLLAEYETLRRGRARSNFHETADFVAEMEADEPQPPEEPPDPDDDRPSADEQADRVDLTYDRGRDEGWKVSKKGGAE